MARKQWAARVHAARSVRSFFHPTRRDKFLTREQRLHVLFHNARAMNTPVDSKSAQGHELMLATNALGPFLLTELLKPLMVDTAKCSPTGSVRIVWVSSIIALGTPQGGIVWDSRYEGLALLQSPSSNDMQSKAGLVFLAHECAREMGRQGIISVSLHPGLLKTELQRHMPALARVIMGAVFKGPKAGAVTEVFAGFSPEVTQEQNGRYIIPWGRFGVLPDHVAVGLRSEEEGGNGLAICFTRWCDSVTQPFRTL
ncbi:3-methyladenine DNA glycosylase [Pestalotiopsis sp. IQ-011]